jgi:hypothetical protein
MPTKDDDRDNNETFSVRDAATANWVIRKITESRAYGRKVRAWAEAEVKRAEREENQLLHRYGGQLEEFARQQIYLQHDGRKSVSLPAGTIGFRIEPTRLAIDDEQTLIRWCREHLPSAIRIMQTMLKAPLMEHLKATGECPKGTDIIGGAERFYISEKNNNCVEGEEGGPNE